MEDFQGYMPDSDIWEEYGQSSVIIVVSILWLGKASKKNFKKSDNYHFRGGGQRGSFITFFFGLKMIFKQF